MGKVQEFLEKMVIEKVGGSNVGNDIWKFVNDEFGDLDLNDRYILAQALLLVVRDMMFVGEEAQILGLYQEVVNDD